MTNDDIISNTKLAIKQLTQGLDSWRAIKSDIWTPLGLSSSMPVGTGANSSVTGQNMADVFATLVALESLLASGHATNIARLL